MNDLALTLACGDYDRTQPLLNGTVRPKNIDLTCVALEPNEIFQRMLLDEAFDASEMSLSNYLMERGQGNHRFTAIPVFLSRMFRHSSIYVNKQAGISRPGDLAGKRVGLSEYHTTAALWIRGMLSDDYGVLPRDITWVVGGIERPGGQDRMKHFTPPQGVEIRGAEPGQCLNELLCSGAIDALISPGRPSCFDNSSIVRLWGDYREVEEDYFRRTRCFPIMHVVVVKTAILEQNPWVAQSLYHAFDRAKELATAKLTKKGTLPNLLPWAFEQAEQAQKLMGDDFWPYGVAANLHVLETMIRYSREQGLCDKPLSATDLFPVQTN